VAAASIGQFAWADVPGYIAAQTVGAFIGAVLVWLAYLPHWAVTTDKDAKLGVFATAPAIRNSAANVITEVIGTAVLVFGVLAIVANALPGKTDQHELMFSAVFSRGLQPLLVGILVLGIGLSLGGPTGYAINPARDFGPRLAHAVLPIAGKRDSDWSYAWIPIVGPLIGGVVGAVVFRAVGF
jgi:glycerol uptake facilitator protein